MLEHGHPVQSTVDTVLSSKHAKAVNIITPIEFQGYRRYLPAHRLKTSPFTGFMSNLSISSKGACAAVACVNGAVDGKPELPWVWRLVGGGIYNDDALRRDN